MKDDSRRGLKRLLAQFLLAGAVAGPATASPTAESDARDDVSKNDDELDDDSVESAVASLVTADHQRASRQLARLLETLDPFEATRAAALVALSPSADVRLALAEALGSRFRIVGARFVLEQLSSDAQPDVRAAAARAIDARAGVLTK